MSWIWTWRCRQNMNHRNSPGNLDSVRSPLLALALCVCVHTAHEVLECDLFFSALKSSLHLRTHDSSFFRSIVCKCVKKSHFCMGLPHESTRPSLPARQAPSRIDVTRRSGYNCLSAVILTAGMWMKGGSPRILVDTFGKPDVFC